MRVSLTQWTFVVAALVVMTVSTGCKSGFSWFGKNKGPSSSAIAGRPTPPSSSFSPGVETASASTAPAYKGSGYPETPTSSSVSPASHSQSPGSYGASEGTRVAGAQSGNYYSPNYLENSQDGQSSVSQPPVTRPQTLAPTNDQSHYSDRASFTNQNFQNPGNSSQQNLGVTNQPIQSGVPGVPGSSPGNNVNQSWDSTPATQPSGSRFSHPSAVNDRGFGATGPGDFNTHLNGVQGAPGGTRSSDLHAPATAAGSSFTQSPTGTTAPAVGSRWAVGEAGAPATGSSGFPASGAPVNPPASTGGSQAWLPGSATNSTPTPTSFR